MRSFVSETGNGEFDDDASWGSSDEDYCDDDDNLDDPGGMAAKPWEEEDSLTTFEDTLAAIRFSVALYFKATLDSSKKKGVGR